MEAVLEVLNFDICDKNFSMRELFSCLGVIAKVYQSLDPATIQKATKFDNLSFIKTNKKARQILGDELINRFERTYEFTLGDRTVYLPLPVWSLAKFNNEPLSIELDTDKLETL